MKAKKKPLRAVPESGYIRLPEVLHILPVCKATFYKGIRSGIYPAPTKISERCSAWKIEEIRQLFSKMTNEG